MISNQITGGTLSAQRPNFACTNAQCDTSVMVKLTLRFDHAVLV